jgi:hypothetical protein
MKTNPQRSKLPVCAPLLQGEGLIKILFFTTRSQILENIDKETFEGRSLSFLEGA